MDIPNANAPVTVDVVLAQDKYEELLESHHLMVFLNDPKANVSLVEGHATPSPLYKVCEYTDPFTGQYGREFGDTAGEAMKAALSVIKTRRQQREAA